MAAAIRPSMAVRACCMADWTDSDTRPCRIRIPVAVAVSVGVVLVLVAVGVVLVLVALVPGLVSRASPLPSAALLSPFMIDEG